MKEKTALPYRKLFLLSLLVITVLLTACSKDAVDLRNPLFSITQPEYRSSEDDDRSKTGGVYFDFYNRADCSVIYIEVRMNVYDKETGGNALTGLGTVTADVSVRIKKGEKKEICIPLDEYITVVKESGYYIDQFYISWIEYEDGKYWNDELGLYAVKGRE